MLFLFIHCPYSLLKLVLLHKCVQFVKKFVTFFFSNKPFNLNLFSMLCTFTANAKRPIPKPQFSNKMFSIFKCTCRIHSWSHWLTVLNNTSPIKWLLAHTVPLKLCLIYVRRRAAGLWKKDVLWKPLPSTCNWLHVCHRLVLNCVLLLWCPSFLPSKTLWNANFRQQIGYIQHMWIYTGFSQCWVENVGVCNLHVI